jgi:hypothetical protein
MSNSELKDKIINSSLIFEENGEIQSFYESHIISLEFKRGQYVSDESGFEDPTIEASIEFPNGDSPYVLDIRFSGCSSVKMEYFNYENTIEEASFTLEARGFYADKITPLPPFIRVEFGTPGYTVHVSFNCFEMEILGKRQVLGPSYA